MLWLVESLGSAEVSALGETCFRAPPARLRYWLHDLGRNVNGGLHQIWCTGPLPSGLPPLVSTHCSLGQNRASRGSRTMSGAIGNQEGGLTPCCLSNTHLGIPTSETLAPRVSTVVDACFSKAFREIKSRLQCELLNIERDAVTRHLTESKPGRSGLILRAWAVEVKGRGVGFPAGVKDGSGCLEALVILVSFVCDASEGSQQCLSRKPPKSESCVDSWGVGEF